MGGSPAKGFPCPLCGKRIKLLPGGPFPNRRRYYQTHDNPKTGRQCEASYWR